MSVYKRLRVFRSVAAVAEALRILLGDCPFMGLVAIEAGHTLLHVEAVLADLGFMPVAFPQTVLGLELYLSVGLMALKALEI